MNCPDYKRLIVRRMLGDLDPEGQRLLADHLGSCTTCSAALARYEGLVEDLGCLGDIYAGIESPFVFTPPEPGVGHGRRHRYRPQFVGSALAAAAAVLFVVLVWPPPRGTQVARQDADSISSPSAGTTGSAAVRMTPPVWPGLGSTGSPERSVTPSLPAMPRFTQSHYEGTGTSNVRLRTPSLIIQQRRLRHHEYPQSHRDDRNFVSDPRPAEV